MNKATMQIMSSLSIGFFKVRVRRSGQYGRRRAISSGFSLVELLIAVALSLIVMTALIALYGNVSRTNNEMRKTNELIENGRFAIQLLQSDLAHAGFWGGIQGLEATAVPDACLSFAQWSTTHTTPETLQAYKVNLMAIPVQGYVKGSNSLSNCGVTDAKVQANSSMLVVRHANTCMAGSDGCAGGTDKVGPHLQVSDCKSAVTPEDPYKLDGVVGEFTNFTLRTKACGTGEPNPDRPAPRRKMISNVYYVGLSDGIPNLMRVSMKEGAYSEPEPLVEGIEAFHVEYGIDNLGTNGNAISKIEPINPADGNADEYVICPAAGCTLAQLENVVTVKLHILSRNLEPTTGYVNNTAYELGTGATKRTVPAFNDAYKRHVFSTTVRLVNVSSPREPAV